MSTLVAPGVTQLPLGIANAYLVEADNGLVAIDTGTPGNADKLLAGIAALGRKPADLREIVLTHQHLDHAGGAKLLQDRFGARLIMSAADYDLLDQQVRFLKGWFRDTLPTAPMERLALMRLDGDLYESTDVALRAPDPKPAPGGCASTEDDGASKAQEASPGSQGTTSTTAGQPPRAGSAPGSVT